MIRTVYDRIVLIDSSAVIALLDDTEARHQKVFDAYHQPTTEDIIWAVLDLTSHECFTRARYKDGFQAALRHYDFMRSNPRIQMHRFAVTDEALALDLLQKHSTVGLSFHDAICAAAMKRIGIFKILSLDSEFHCFGFDVLPY